MKKLVGILLSVILLLNSHITQHSFHYHSYPSLRFYNIRVKYPSRDLCLFNRICLYYFHKNFQCIQLHRKRSAHRNLIENLLKTSNFVDFLSENPYKSSPTWEYRFTLVDTCHIIVYIQLISICDATGRVNIHHVTTRWNLSFFVINYFKMS